MRREGEGAIAAGGDLETGGGDGEAMGAQALAMTRSSQVMVDRRINPNYATNTEVFAETWEGKTAVVLPAGLTVNVGDVIEFDQGRVNPSDPCQYIPNLAVSTKCATFDIIGSPSPPASCRLLGEDRTWRASVLSSEFDPKRS